MNLSKFQEIKDDRVAWSAAVHGVTKNWTLLSNLTTTTYIWQLPLMHEYCYEAEFASVSRRWEYKILMLLPSSTGYRFLI